MAAGNGTFPACMLALVLVIIPGFGYFIFPIFMSLNIDIKDRPAVGI